MTDDNSDPYDPELTTFHVAALGRHRTVTRSPCPPTEPTRPDRIFGQRYDIECDDGSIVSLTSAIDKIIWDSLDPRYREKTVLTFYSRRVREFAEEMVKDGRDSADWITHKDSWAQTQLLDIENELKAEDLEL